MNLQDLANTLKYQEVSKNSNRFDGTPIDKWNSLAGTVKSAVAVEAMVTWLTSNGITVSDPSSSDHDKIISKVKTELKMATCQVKGHYIWNQIRTTQDYGAVIFTAIKPEGVRLFWCSKEEAAQVGSPQHDGRDDILMITHKEGEFPSVFKEFTTAQPGLHTSPLWFTG